MTLFREGTNLTIVVNLPYSPQTITIATQKKHKKLLNVKKSDPKHVYVQYNSIVVDMNKNQKYQRFNKCNISD